MQKTIALVKAPRSFPTNSGDTIWVVDVIFDDESEGSSFSNSEQVAMQHKEALDKIKGVPTELDIEFKRNFNGHDEYKMKNFPGKPQQQGSGRSSKSGGNWESAEERAQWRGSLEAQAALNAALLLHNNAGGVTVAAVIAKDAAVFAEALKTMREAAGFTVPPKPVEPVAPSAGNSAAPSTSSGAPSASSTDGQSATVNSQAAASGDDWESIRNAAMGLYGNDANALMDAYADKFGERHAPSRMPAERLLELIANPV